MKSRDMLLDTIRDMERFKEGIKLNKTSSALQYADSNDPKHRIDFQRYEYAESQANILINMFRDKIDPISRQIAEDIKNGNC